MQQPIRYYISGSGDEPTLRSVRIARPQVDRQAKADSDHLKADSREVDGNEAVVAKSSHGASVKERLQDAIRKHAIAQ